MAGARSYSELDAWNLANELKLAVYSFVATGRAKSDESFTDQITRSAASAPANIAEGFGRFEPREIAPFLRIANGSLMETSNHLQDGVDRGYFTSDQIAPALTMARRASAATTRWIRYLKTAKRPERRRR